MYNLLETLDGNKTKLLGIAGVLLGAATRLGYIDSAMSLDILSILTILAGGTAVATDKVLGARFRSKA